MPVVIEAVDLGALAAVLLLIGLLMATAYTFERLAGALDVSILGVRPFHSIASAIRAYVIDGVNEGIDALKKVASDLWAGTVWAVKEMVSGVSDAIDALDRSWSWLTGSGLTHAIQAITGPIAARAEQAWNYGVSLATTVTTEVARLDGKIDRGLAAAASQARRELADARTFLEGEIVSRISTVESDIRAATADVLSQAEAASSGAIDRLRQAEDAAIQAATAAETATAGELRDLLNGITPGDVAALLAAVPLLKAAVQTLEEEAGLSRAECRAKVKQICGVDPSRWAHLIEGLLFAFTWEGLVPFAEAVAEAVPEVLDAVTALVEV